MGKERGRVACILVAGHRACTQAHPSHFAMAGMGLLTLHLTEEKMAKIVIKDLTANADLDRKAMRAIAGGARSRSAGAAIGLQPERGQRIVDFSLGRRSAGSAPTRKTT